MNVFQYDPPIIDRINYEWQEYVSITINYKREKEKVKV